jgi:hypothetical protein
MLHPSTEPLDVTPSRDGEYTSSGLRAFPPMKTKFRERWPLIHLRLLIEMKSFHLIDSFGRQKQERIIFREMANEMQISFANSLEFCSDRIIINV